jgi:oligoendopeptidase F
MKRLPACVSMSMGGQSLSLEPTLSLLQDNDGGKRKAAAQALSRRWAANCAPSR